MAVLCILSHGGQGFICGSDGEELSMHSLSQYLDNKNCSAMANKPKLIIIQACQGSMYFLQASFTFRIPDALLLASIPNWKS